MFSFFDKIRNYLLIALIIGIGVISFYLVSVKSDLKLSQADLEAANGRVTTLENTNKTLRNDLGSKEAINLTLSTKMIIVSDASKTTIENLSQKLTAAMVQRKTSVIAVDKTSYIKESYVENATNIALEQMWIGYCKTKGDCK
jgi:hypothetical protein